MLLHLPSRLSFFVCFQVCLLNVVRWWWLLYGFFLFLRLLLNLISAISGPSLCHQNLCCTIPEAKAPRVGYTVFGRGTLFFSMILKGSACSHYFASVNSVCAEKKKPDSYFTPWWNISHTQTSLQTHCPLGTHEVCILFLSPGFKCQLSPSRWPWGWLNILGFVWRRIIHVMLRLPLVKGIP